jgi:hypothetical protein
VFSFKQHEISARRVSIQAHQCKRPEERMAHMFKYTSLPESGPLPSARSFAECFLSGTWQSPALSNDLIYRVQDTWYRITLGKDSFTECRTLGKDGARQRAVSDCLKMTTVNLCRGSKVGTRQRGFFAECQLDDTRQRPLYRVPFLALDKIHFYFFNFGNQTFVVCSYIM